jgi:glycosidase
MDYIIYSEDSVVAHWLGLGADGFRLDVADELPDEFILAFKTRMKQINPDALLIGEVWEDASNKISYGKRRRYFSASELDSVMNYPFRTAILDFIKGRISGYDFADRVMNIVENYPLPVLQCNMNSLSTHDTCRVLTEISDAKASSDKGERARFRLSGEEKSRAISLEMAAALLQFTLPGNPCIYYGDEIGMEGYEDPLNRGFFRWADVECDLHRFYKSLSLVKNENEALRLGIIVFYTVDDRRIVFSRKLENTEVMVELNLKGDAVNASNTLLSFSRDNISAAVYLKDRVEGNI